MRIIDETEIKKGDWATNHSLEIGEAKAFIESGATMAELDPNPNFSKGTQRSNYVRVFHVLLGPKAWSYKVFTRGGKIIVRRNDNEVKA